MLAFDCHVAVAALNHHFSIDFRCETNNRVESTTVACLTAVQNINTALGNTLFACYGTEEYDYLGVGYKDCESSVTKLNEALFPPPGPPTPPPVPPPTPPPTPPPSPPSPPTPPTCDECFYCGVSTIFNTRSHAIDAVSSIYVAAF